MGPGFHWAQHNAQEAEQRLPESGMVIRQLEEVLEDFYGKCLPEKIYNIAALRHFIKSHPFKGLVSFDRSAS